MAEKVTKKNEIPNSLKLVLPPTFLGVVVELSLTGGDDFIDELLRGKLQRDPQLSEDMGGRKALQSRCLDLSFRG